MQPPAHHSGSGHVHGLSIQLADGNWVPLEAVIAEGRRQRAQEIRRLARAMVQWIARTARTFVSLVPAPESKRKIPRAVPMGELLAARNADNWSGDAGAFGTGQKRDGDDRPLYA